MKTRVDEKLIDEVNTFRLRFACDDCGHFDPKTETCSHGYPSLIRIADLAHADISFCKEFELGSAEASKPSEPR